jgi:protein-disulfide isomerase
MTRRKILISFFVLVLIALAGAAWFAVSPSRDAAEPALAAASLPPDRVTADDKVIGNANAPVTMIEYFAQACSGCAHFDLAVFPQLKAKYIDTGKVRYVMRFFPLFPVDGPAYKLDLCMPKDHFFHTVDLLFRNQPQWDSAEYPGADTPGGLRRMARVLGLPDAQAQACMNSTAQDAAINRIAQEGFARYAIGSTPTFVLDFRKVEIVSWPEAQSVIDASLAAKGIK